MAIPKLRRSAGFTLIELMMVIAIMAILATLAVSAYRIYVLKAQEVQALVDYGHIRTVVAVRTQADGATNLQENSVPGEVPPALAGSLDAKQFNGPDGMVFQFIRAPAGTFASYPNDDVYALVATVNNAAGVLRLRVLRSILPHSDGDKIWVQSSADATSAQLMYPIQMGAGDTGPGSAVAGGGGSANGGTTVIATPPGESPGTAINPPAGTTGSGGSSTTGSDTTTTPSTGSTTNSTTGSTANTGSGTSTGSGSTGNTTTGGGDASVVAVPPAANNTSPSSSGSSNITGSAAVNGNTWTASAQICIGGVIGQTNTSVVFQVVTQYANFSVNQMLNPSTGCTSYSYGGLPMSSNAQISVQQVVNYNPPNSGGTSTQWDGAKPSVTITP